MNDLRVLVNQGELERALEVATKRSVELIRDSRHDDASRALAFAADILCTLNQPLRSRAFACEALEMAQTSADASLEHRACAAGVRALLRLGEIDKAEVERGGGLPGLDGTDPLVLLVGAEVALATDAICEARAFAHRAGATATEADDVVHRARAQLILGVCAIRECAYKAAVRPLTAAITELESAPHAETFWQVQAALATVSRKLGRTDQAARHQALAAASAQGVADGLSEDARERFLGSPTVQAALGSGRTGWSRIPATTTRDGEEAWGPFRPFLTAFRRLNVQRGLPELLTVIVESMIELSGAQRGTIAMFDGEFPRPEISRAEQAQGFQPFEMNVARAVLGIVRESGQSFLVDDIRRSDALDARADHVLSVLCVPLRVGHKVLGAVYLDSPGASGAFEEHDREMAELLADHSAIALENVLVHEHAIRDGLTLLYNQTHVEECLEREIATSRRDGRPCGLLMVDIDDFKSTNDGMGHAAGNDLLRALAPMLTGAVRSIDVVARVEARGSLAVVARYGGDEFEIMLPDTGKDGLATVARRIVLAVRTLNVSVSIGGACFPEDASNALELMQRADIALYQAKQAGKNRYQAYTAPLTEALASGDRS